MLSKRWVRVSAELVQAEEDRRSLQQEQLRFDGEPRAWPRDVSFL